MRLWMIKPFQSFFSWMWLLRPKAAHPRPCRGRVSILLFVDVALEADGQVVFYHTKAVFQSFFSWMWLLRQPAGRYGGTQKPVSILLFVDVALEAFPAGGGCGFRDSFNPSFRGCGS